MTFKIIVQQMPVGVEFEVGSLSEAAAILEQEDSQIRKIGAMAKSLNDEEGAATAETPARRTRGPNKPKPPVEATAPDPIPVPTAPVVASPPVAPAAPPPGFEIPADGGIPPALVRTAAPPLPAVAPAVAPVAAPPPVGVLGPKVVKALDALKEGKPDGGQALADWLAAAGLTIKGKTYDEATRALLMISDEKITAAGILEPLSIAA